MRDLVLVHCPYPVSYGPDPKLVSPWGDPYCAHPQISPVTYRISKDGELAETTVHLGRIKQCRPPLSPSAPDFSELDDMFLGTILPVVAMIRSLSVVRLGPYTVERIGGHKRGDGAASVDSFQYLPKLVDKTPQLGIWRHVSAVPQCNDMIVSYRKNVLSREPHAFDTPRCRSTAAVASCID